MGRKDQVHCLARLIPAAAGALLFSVASCSSEPIDAGPTRADVLAAYVAGGDSDAVANCVIGLAGRDHDLADIDPNAGNPVVAEIVKSCRTAVELNNPVDAPTELAFAPDPHAYGDDLRLDVLWDMCADGTGKACDLLWNDAPVGSEYERFGVTCGDREDVLDCTDLDKPDEDGF